ncbi:hypothetical protein WICMUC_003364 [Wickerhamomyces mucosus]|uniref:Uncharacterized protein n=1 Tax=Wickerhamomyces mucosus TaxID=1378264 RepID=A0A9P8PL67_9ASCO|nr:hypothetical protein WICMUC_003364 [Wickerhamomyces mucosus]
MLSRKSFKGAAIQLRPFLNYGARRRSSSHGSDSHSSDAAIEENLSNNPQYIYVLSGIGLASIIIGLDNIYKHYNDYSFLGSFISPTKSTEIAESNVKYAQKVEESKKLTNLMNINPPNNNGFRNLNGLTNNFKKTTLPFNYAVGDNFKTEGLKERRVHKSIFD